MISRRRHEPPPRHGPRRSVRALRHRDFALFWVAALVTNSGSWLQNLAAPYVLYESTGSAVWVGLATTGQLVPYMLLGPVAGVLAERAPLRRTLLIAQSARALTALAMFVLWTAGVRQPLVLLLAVVAAGCAQGLSMPSWQAFVHRIARPEDLASAVTLNTAQFNLSRSFGPAVGGVVLVAWGPSWAFLLTFLAVSCVVVVLPAVRPAPPVTAADAHGPTGPGRKGDTGEERGATDTRVLRQFTEALSYTRGRPGLVLALSLIAVVGLLGMPVFQHVIVFTGSVLPSGPAALPLLYTALGIGTVLALPLVGRSEQRIGRAGSARWSLPLYGLSLTAFGCSSTLWSAGALLVVVGACFLVSFSVGNNTVHLLVADRMRGRVLALSVMVYTGSTATGAWLQGLLSDLVGARETVIAAGCALVLVSVPLRYARGRFSAHRLDGTRDAPGSGGAHRGTARTVAPDRAGYSSGTVPRPGGTTMSEHTPSQAEGDRDEDEWTTPDVPHTTPSQAEGERDPADATEPAHDNAERG
ncbi:MFS transporter [Streptomyces griseoflavus]|uniref:MFS transporter n=1 Tax=Streptomyces griseoflavus TaxID=35619 RepID=UPI0033AFDC64